MLAIAPHPVHAAAITRWTQDGVAVCTAAGNQQNPRIVEDGAGGVIIIWQDRRGISEDIYAQRLLAGGTAAPGWPARGLGVCTAAFGQTEPQLVSDGAGGAIVTWQDGRAGPSAIYAQRVLPGGTVSPGWPANGVALTASVVGGQGFPQIITDGASGAIVTWQDSRSGNPDIYAQHVRADGTVDPSWPVNGASLCTAVRNQLNPQIASDGAGGAIVAWYDARTIPSNTVYDIYGQRVLATGSVDPGWPANGVALCIAYSSQLDPQLVPDGLGGAIVAWNDRRAGQPIDPVYEDIYAQRVSAAGVPQWTVDGVGLCIAESAQELPQVASDGAGGALVVWQDHRAGNFDIYAQHVLANGSIAPGLPADGVALCTIPGNQTNPQIVSDGAGGALVTWQDTFGGTEYHIYAHHLLAGGTPSPAWPADGIAVCTAANSQENPRIASDGAGGAIIVWQDSRAGGNYPLDIYAQRVSDNSCAAPAAAARPPRSQSCGVVDWTRAANGFYLDVANWNGGSGPVPTGTCPATCALYDARFGIGGATYAVNFIGSPTSARVTVTAGDHPTFNLGGNTYRASELDLEGTGSSLRISRGAAVVDDTVQVGRAGGAQSNLEIANGGAVTCAAATVGPSGAAGPAIGHVTVQSGGMWRVDGRIAVGGPGVGPRNGILDLNDGCTVCAGSIHLGARGQVNAGATAIAVSGTALSQCSIPPGSARGVFADTIEIDAGTAVDSVALEPGGVLMSASPIARDLTNSGTLSPGSHVDGVGMLTLNASYSQTSIGRLVIDLGGDAPGDGYDALRVAGPATLGGSLDWKLVNGYRPLIGQTFEVLVAHPLHGVFDTVSENIDVAYTDTSVVLTATSATPVLASLVSAEAEPGRVSVRWLVSETGGPVTIQRAREMGAWGPVATRLPDGAGIVSYEDRDVTEGRYGYRLGLPSEAFEIAAGEVWVTVPVESRFGLAGVYPNPAAGPLAVSFSLGDSQPAALELFDLVGRRVEGRTIESPRPGSRVVTLGGSRELPAGVYVLRLAQGARHASCRVAVVR